MVPHHKFLLKHRQHTEHNCPLQPPALPSGIVMNADSDNGGVNKNKSQANLMKGVSAGEVNAKINQIPSNICDYHISQKN